MIQEATEMQTERDQRQKSDDMPNAQSDKANSASENSGSELETPHWSIVTFEGIAVSNLKYEEAVEWVKKLDSQKISGLCIVTDEAAARMSE